MTNSHCEEIDDKTFEKQRQRIYRNGQKVQQALLRLKESQKDVERPQEKVKISWVKKRLDCESPVCGAPVARCSHYGRVWSNFTNYRDFWLLLTKFLDFLNF